MDARKYRTEMARVLADYGMQDEYPRNLIAGGYFGHLITRTEKRKFLGIPYTMKKTLAEVISEPKNIKGVIRSMHSDGLEIFVKDRRFEKEFVEIRGKLQSLLGEEVTLLYPIEEES